MKIKELTSIYIPCSKRVLTTRKPCDELAVFDVDDSPLCALHAGELALDYIINQEKGKVPDKDGKKTRIDPLDVLSKEMIATEVNDRNNEWLNLCRANNMEEVSLPEVKHLNFIRDELLKTAACQIGQRTDIALYKRLQIESPNYFSLFGSIPVRVLSGDLVVDLEIEDPNITVHESCSAFSQESSDYLTDRFDVSKLVNDE